METSLGGMLIMGVMLAAIVLMSRSIIVADLATGTAIKEAAELSGERARTELTLMSFPSIGSDLYADVKNSGSTSIAKLERIDYIIHYTQTNDNLKIIRLAYDTANPAAGEWEPTAITPDSFNPGIWDPGETLTLEGHISPPPKSGTTGWVWVSSPNGVVATGTFTVP